MLGLASPLLLAAFPVRAVRAATRTHARRGVSQRSTDGQHSRAGQPDGVAARLLYRGVRFYQAELSRLTPRCPHTPSCSQYAAEALCRHGAARGSWLTMRRLLRCRPGTAGGFDPVGNGGRERSGKGEIRAS